LREGIATLIEDCVYRQEHDGMCIKIGVKNGKTAQEITEMPRIKGILEAINSQLEEENEEMKVVGEA
jgi:hypothetical protein